MRFTKVRLCLLIYMEHLVHTTVEAVQNLATFADGKVDDGTMKHRRLVMPPTSRLRKWLSSTYKEQDLGVERSLGAVETNYVYCGDSYDQKKNPEHLPAANAWQHFGNGCIQISTVLASKESAFGFRVACATMSISILAFLENTQTFFQGSETRMGHDYYCVGNDHKYVSFSLGAC